MTQTTPAAPVPAVPVPATSAADMTANLREIMARELSTDGTTKRQALRIALVWAINSGHLTPGTRLPAETTLAQDLGVSLGTVQAALGQVQDLGLIERRRGDGTRVSLGSGFSSSIWHFRMHVIDSGEQFRILNQEVEVLQSSARGPWCDHLGDRPNYTVIRRRIAGNNDTMVGAEMVLDAELAPAHTLSANELRQTNIRTVLEQKLKVKAARAVHRVRLKDVDPRRLAMLGLELNQPILRVRARTFLSDERPFYFQTLYVPANRIELEL